MKYLIKRIQNPTNRIKKNRKNNHTTKFLIPDGLLQSESTNTYLLTPGKEAGGVMVMHTESYARLPAFNTYIHQFAKCLPLS